MEEQSSEQRVGAGWRKKRLKKGKLAEKAITR